MNKLVTVILILSASYAQAADSFFSRPDSNLNIIDKALIANRMVQARDKFLLLDYRGAMNTYREVIADDPTNAEAHYRVADCHFHLQNYETALDFLNKAVTLKPDVDEESDLLFGRLYHRLEKLDEALAAYDRYSKKLTETKIKEYEIDLALQQVKTAKELMAKPVNVKVTNLGTNINSRNDDYYPLTSADGKKIYFVSRRPGSTGALTAVDFKYFEDIYTSEVTAEGQWDKSERFEEKVNTDEFDACNHLTKDGMTMYVTYNINGFTKSSDIAIARQSKSGKWSMGKLYKKPVNTTYADFGPTLPETEDVMYFISERPGGKGAADLWKVTMNKGKSNGEPTNVGTLNTPYDETTPFIHPNGKYMFFSSEGHGSMGGYDIFVSEFKEGSWATPRNLGYPINSVNNDAFFKLSADGKKAYFSSVRKDGNGELDIYEVDLSTVNIFTGQ